MTLTMMSSGLIAQSTSSCFITSLPSKSLSEVEQMISRAADMVELALAEGIDAAIARFHAREPGARRTAADPESEPTE